MQSCVECHKAMAVDDEYYLSSGCPYCRGCTARVRRHPPRRPADAAKCHGRRDDGRRLRCAVVELRAHARDASEPTRLNIALVTVWLFLSNQRYFPIACVRRRLRASQMPLLAGYVDVFVDHPGGCYTCRWFGERVGFDVRRADPRAPHVRSLPEQGCAFWEREPGSDD